MATTRVVLMLVVILCLLSGNNSTGDKPPPDQGGALSRYRELVDGAREICGTNCRGTQGTQDLGTKIAMGKKIIFLRVLDGFSRKKYGKVI